MPIAYQHRVVVLDVGKPSAPRIAWSLATDTTFTVHWSSLDPASDRVVLSGQGDGDPLLLIARLNDRTGALTLDTLFRAPGATSPGMRFDRMPFPNGLMGPAMPHGAVFVPR
jgi:hypothetical protein